MLLLFSATPMSTGTPDCEDKLITCSLIDASYYCQGEYLQYGYDNCRKTCNLCHTTTLPTQTKIVSTQGMLFIIVRYSVKLMLWAFLLSIVTFLLKEFNIKIDVALTSLKQFLPLFLDKLNINHCW